MKAIMYGAGNIGRGFIAQLLYESGYEVVFVDINPKIIDCINKDRQYPIKLVSREGQKEIIIKNVRAVNGNDTAAVASEIADADLMATAVGSALLQKIIPTLAMGLRKRWENKNSQPINILICENLMDANHYLRDLFNNELSNAEMELLDQKVGLVETSIGRMVPIVTDEMQEGNPLRLWAEDYNSLPIDKDALIGEVPKIVNIQPYSPFEFYLQRKLFVHNMGHAFLAYLGRHKGYQYVWEAIEDPTIRLLVTKAMQESCIALSLEHGVEISVLKQHAQDLIYRFGNRYLDDTVERVGKDIKRKLSPNDRMIGAVKLCIKNGVDPVFIAVGIASALLYTSEKDPGSYELKRIISERGIEAALKEFCGIDEYKGFIDYVFLFYDLMQKKLPYNEILYTADKLKDIEW